MLTYPAEPRSETIFPGFPMTTDDEGTSKLTNAPGAISASSPTRMLPTTIAYVPIHTRSPIVGAPFLLPRLSGPMVAPRAMLTLLPITA